MEYIFFTTKPETIWSISIRAIWRFQGISKHTWPYAWVRCHVRILSSLYVSLIAFRFISKWVWDRSRIALSFAVGVVFIAAAILGEPSLWICASKMQTRPPNDLRVYQNELYYRSNESCRSQSNNMSAICKISDIVPGYDFSTLPRNRDVPLNTWLVVSSRFPSPLTQVACNCSIWCS